MEKYIKRCLDSVCVEDVMDYVEVIIVNDGSKDRTLEIAKEYERRYPGYFTVIDKANGNYGSCMNRGLAIARGKYFRTLDADDWYDTQAFRDYIVSLSSADADIVMSERDEIIDGVHYKKRFDTFISLDRDLWIAASMWNNTSIMGLCHVSSFCYKTSILRDSDLRWSESVFYTDNEYLFLPLPFVKKIRFVPKPVYQYDKSREDRSTSTNNLRKNFHSYFTVANRLLDSMIEYYSPQSSVFPLQMRILRMDLLPYCYMSLFMDGFKHKNEIDELERKVKLIPELYRSTDHIADYRNFLYVNAYRNNIVKFLLIRLDYRLRSCKSLKSILRKR